MEFTQVKKDELNLLLKELKDDHYLIISKSPTTLTL